jgi:hypothetical protein
MLILLWGLKSDTPLAAVHAELNRHGAPVVFLDQAAASSAEMKLWMGADVRGCLRISEQVFDLSAITAAYVRPDDFRQLPRFASSGPGSDAWQRAAGLEERLWSWAEMTPACVVSRPSAMAANGSKAFQLRQIQTAGFRVPATLVTTDPVAVREFWQQHGTVIYKSVSGVRSIVARLQPADVARLEDVRHCPTQFQEYIEGTDHRVHVVGPDVFAAEVRTDATDYRYPGGSAVEIVGVELPEEVADRCRRMADSMRLPVAGIDLRRTPGGDWYCFEVNPSPAFTYYEQATARPITAAVAALLMSGGARP